MLQRNFRSFKEESVISLINVMLNGLYLLSNDREHFKFDTVELIKTTPGTTACKTFEELTHGFVIETIRAVKHNTLSCKCLWEIFDCLSFTSTSWTFWSSSIMKINCTAKCSVASIGEWCDDKSTRVTQVLIVVRKNTVDDLGPNIVVLPIISELWEPLEFGWVTDLLVNQILLDDIFSMDIKYDKCLKCGSL